MHTYIKFGVFIAALAVFGAAVSMTFSSTTDYQPRNGGNIT